MSNKHTIRFLIPLQTIDVEVELPKNGDAEEIAHNAFFKMVGKLRYEVGKPR